MKKVLVTGSSGYVANYIMKTLARKFPEVSVVGMSRSAKPRDDEIKRLKNVSYVKGDCLDPKSFKEHVQDVDGIIHCVGTLFEKRGDPKASYLAMNRDTCVNMASELQDVAEAKD